MNRHAKDAHLTVVRIDLVRNSDLDARDFDRDGNRREPK